MTFVQLCIIKKFSLRTKETNFSHGRNDDDLAVTLAVLDRGFFLEYYGNRSLFDKGRACNRMFRRVSTAAYDAVCQNEGQQDFLR